jgi:hypothetical protein
MMLFHEGIKMVAGLVASILKLGYTGLVAADLGIHITALANEGAGIYREIPDRRQALVEIQNQYETLQNRFSTELEDVTKLSNTVNTSLQSNNLLYLDLDGFFASLTALHVEFEKSGLADPIKNPTINYQRLSPAEKKVVDYLLPVAGTTFFTIELASYVRSMSRRTTRVDQMVHHLNDIRAWNRLTPEQRSMLTNRKFGVKNPRLISGYKLMKSALKYSGMAAISIGSIAYKATKEKEELDDLNAAIAGVHKYIQVLNGEIAPDESDFTDEISPDDNDYIYSFPRLGEHKDRLMEFDGYDFENFMTVINFFRDIYHGAESESLARWREAISLGESGAPGDTLFEGLYNLVYFPRGNLGLKDLSCFTQNNWSLDVDAEGKELLYPYQKADMRCIQGGLHNFFAAVGVNVLRLAIEIAPTVPNAPELTDKKRQDIISVCTNRVYKNLKPEAIRALIKRTKFVTDEEINQVLSEDLSGLCPFPS